MTAVTRPRGPLPPQVYWIRRLVVLLVALAVVFGAVRLLGGGGGSGNGPSARPVGADQTTASTSPTATSTATDTATDTASPGASGAPSGGATPSGQTGSTTPTAPATPSGACENSDIVALPSVASPAYAAHPVTVSMTLTTRSAPACTWRVSADSLVVKVTARGKRFWSTQDCSAAVPEQSVVVRKDTPTTIAMSWNGMRSDADCTRTTSYAYPGYYHVVAAAFGADPADSVFRLLTPVRPTVTATPTPTPSERASSGSSKAATASPQR